MANPSVENLKPGESGDFNPETSIYSSVRDNESRIDRGSVNEIVTFSKTSYLPTGIPYLSSQYVDVFNDALPETRPEDPVSRYISTDIAYDSDGDGVNDSTYGPVLTLEKAIAGEATEKGVLFVEADVGNESPVGCEIQMGVFTVSSGPSDYLSDTAYVGVVAGFVYWPRNTGIFVFFKNDGATKSIEVTGPAQDGSGTRLRSTTTVVDWSSSQAAPASIRVVMDPTPRQNKVWVFLTEESDGTFSETLLFEESLDDIGTLQAAARIGNYFAEAPPNKAVAFAGIDAGSPGDFVEIHNIHVDEFGLYLLATGYNTSESTYSRSTSDLLKVATFSDMESWETSQLEGLVEETDTVFTINRTAAAGNCGAYYSESDLSGKHFMVVFQGSVRSSAHEGSQSSGFGVDICDGEYLTALRFLDDFESQRIGILHADSGTANRDNTASFHAADSAWGETTPEILLLADSGQSLCELFISESSSTAVSSVSSSSLALPYSNVATTEDPGVKLGFVDGDTTLLNYGGTATVSKLFVLPRFLFFLPQSAYREHVDSGVIALPNEAGTWPVWAAAGTTSVASAVESEANPRWKISPSAHTEYLYYSLSYAEDLYLPRESGISVVADIKVENWIDQYGVTDSVRIPSCALIAIDIGEDLFLQLQCVLSTTGETYLFMGQDSQDYIEVLNQTELGQKISALVDLSVAHTYLVSYRPGDGIYLFIDFADVPAIYIPWSDRSAVEKSSDYLSAGTTVSVGAIPYSASLESATLSLGLIGVSVGSGFNFKTTMAVSDSVLEDKIYGAAANVFVDVMDKD